jgi:hypothetical protein
MEVGKLAADVMAGRRSKGPRQRNPLLREGRRRVALAPLPWPIVLATLAFALSRLYLLVGFTAYGSDTAVYAQYALEAAEAARQGQSLYSYREQLFDERSRRAAAEGVVAPPPYDFQVEYPPLALAVILLPQKLFAAAREASGSPLPALNRYRMLFRGMLALVDAALFVALLWLIGRLFPGEGDRGAAERLVLYAAGGLVLGHLLYDRLDLLMTALIVFAFALLISRAHYLWSWLLFALAVHYKLVPLLLAPVWIIGAMAPRAPDEPLHGVVRRLIARALALLAVLALPFLPLYLWAGRPGIAFLSFHWLRGVEIESVAASLLVLARAVAGQRLEVVSEFGGQDAKAPLAPVLGAISPVVTLLGIAVGSGFLMREAVRDKPASVGADGPTHLARRSPRLFFAWAAALLLLAMTTSKVLSAQYFVWLLPLAGLLDAPPRRRRAYGLAFLVLFALTTTIFPCLYFAEILGERLAKGKDGIFVGPTRIGAALLLARNGLLVALTATWVAGAVRQGYKKQNSREWRDDQETASAPSRRSSS